MHARGGEAAYAQYVRHLEKSSPAVQASMKAGTVENFANGYQDYLQAPLQVCLFWQLRCEILLTWEGRHSHLWITCKA